MGTPKIQLSGIILILLSCISLLIPPASRGQCTNATFQFETHSQTLTGNGSSTFSPTPPQFNPTSGKTLVSVVVTSTITATTTVTYQNTNASTVHFFPTVNRGDVIQLNGTPLTNGSASAMFPYTTLQPFGSPGDNVSYGPTNKFNNYRIIYDSITSSDPTFSSFQGSGSLALDYFASTSFSTPGGVNISSTVSDQINLSIIYYYCNPIVLARELVTFTAIRKDENTILLNWTRVNEEPGRVYGVEVGGDGASFTGIASQPSDPVNKSASYSYSYAIRPLDKGKLYFRLKIADENNKVDYSPVRVIDLRVNSIAPTFATYPNPAKDFIILNFPYTAQTWRTDIFAADGSPVQRFSCHNTITGRLNFDRKLPAGAYFVRAFDPQTTKDYTSSFIIR